MGGAVSSNVAQAVTTISNNIKNSTTVDTNTYNTCYNKFRSERCTFSQPVDIKNICEVQGISKTIINQTSDNTLNNTISQQLAQQAESAVGAAGIGYAEAVNVANVFAGATNAITNAVSSTVTQNNTQITEFECRDSDFLGSLIYEASSNANFLSEQIATNISNNEVVNNIKQQIDQKATATVQGLAALLVAIAILIVAIGWVLFRPLQIAMGSKIFVLIIIILIILAVILVMYLRQLPPFFNEPVTCINIPGAVIGGCTPNTQCVDVEDKREISIEKPPLRYAYSILGLGDPSIDPHSSTFTPGLVQMVISSHGGWSEASYNNLQADQTLAGLPPLLVACESSNRNCPVSGYQTNITEWNKWLNETDSNGNQVNAANARYILSRNLGLETYAVIHPEYEKCDIGDSTYPNPSTNENKCYVFKPHTAPTRAQNGITSGGVITGEFGYCNTPLYRTQKYIRIGGIIVLFIIILLMIYLFVFRRGGKSKSV